MADEYDTNAFVIFIIALLSIYILCASIFLYKRIRRAMNKQPVKKRKSQQLVETEEEVIENPLTAAFWIHLALVIIAIIIVLRLSNMTSEEEPEIFDPYKTLGIQIGASDRAIKSAYRKMAKIYHPDKPTGSVEKFRDVEKAYRILTDEIAKANYEMYGNPDGPVAMKVGIALPEWMLNGGSTIVIIFYLLLMVVGIPALVWGLKKCSKPKEKAKISEDTASLYYHMMNDSTPLQSVPEIFSIATEFIELMKPKPYDDDLLTYMSIMCPKKDSFANSKMRKPRVPVEKAREDPKLFAWLKTNILVHAYLNHLPVSAPHQRDIDLILLKAPELMQCMTQLAMISRIRGKPVNLSLLTTIVHFQQCMYQGQWVGDSPLKQLPNFNDREANSNQSRNRENSLKELLEKDPSEWKGIKHLLPEQLEDAKRVSKHLPRLEVKVNWQVEDEEDIFPNDPVTCTLKIVQKQLLPEGVTAKQAMEGEIPEEDSDEEKEEEEETEKEEEEVKMALTAEEMEEMAKPRGVTLEPGIVYSKYFTYRIHDHWLVALTDADDKCVYDLNIITPTNMVDEIRVFIVRAPKAGLNRFHIHFLHGAYQGLDFVVAANMRVKPESEKPKVEVNQKDLDLDKQRGLMDMLNMEMDDGWASSDEEDEEEEKEKKKEKREDVNEKEDEEDGEQQEEEEEKEEKVVDLKQLSKKERQRLYHKQKKAAEKAKKEKEAAEAQAKTESVGNTEEDTAEMKEKQTEDVEETGEDIKA